MDLPAFSPSSSSSSSTFLALASTALLLAFSSWFLLSRRLASMLHAPPGSLGLPLIGETLSFFRAFSSPNGVYDFILKRRSRFGNIFKTHLLGHVTIFVSSKEGAKYVSALEGKTIEVEYAKSIQELLGHDSIFSVRGNLHRKMRHLAGDPLSPEALKKHIGTMESCALSVLNQWEGRTVVVYDEAAEYAFQIIAELLLGLKKGPAFEKMRAGFEMIANASFSLPIRLPRSKFSKGLKARRDILLIIDEIIKLRRNGSRTSEIEHHDFLQSMLDLEGLSDDAKLTEAQLKDVILSLLVAGHHTSATALMWCLKYLEDNHTVLEALWIEHQEIQDKRLGGASLMWEDINNMTYTKKVIDETLRLANVSHWLPRKAIEDIEIGDYRIEKGWMVNIDLHSIHVDPSSYDDPLEFKPSRFLEKPNPYTFIPFGLGPRICLGMNLAKISVTIFIHHLVTKYRWKALNKDSSLDISPFPRLKSGYPIHVDLWRP